MFLESERMTIGMREFFINNWVDLLLIIVGLSAFVIYFIQERRKISEAASLISMQVEEIQKQISEVGTFIVNGKLNESAFYESQILFKTDYWDMYKHYFVRKIDAYSFSLFDDFYNCASEILEQQQLMKNLQKNSFFLNQQCIINIEANAVQQSLSICMSDHIDVSQLIKALESTESVSMDEKQKIALENTIRQICTANSNVNFDCFWKQYREFQNNMYAVVNNKAFTTYIPEQIRITLENALKRNNSIQIIGCEGYRKLKKLAKR